MGLTRQQALWNARLLRDDNLPLFDAVTESGEPMATLPAIRPQRHVVLDYHATGLSLKAHPVSFARPRLDESGVRRCADLADAHRVPDGARVKVAGVVLVRQRPGTASGVTFITLEDETGIANLIVWKRVYERFRREARARLLIACGQVQREGEVVHVVVKRLKGFDEALDGLSAASRDFR